MTWIAAANISLLFALGINQLCLRRYGLAAVLVVSGVVWALTMADMPADHTHFGDFCLHPGDQSSVDGPVRGEHVPRFVLVPGKGPQRADPAPLGEVLAQWAWIGG